DGREKRPSPVRGEKAAPRPDVADQLVENGVVSKEEASEARAAIQAGRSAATYEKRAAADVLADPMADAADSKGDADAIRPAFEARRSEEHTSELQSRENLVCRLLLEKKKLTPIGDGAA